MKKLPRWGVWLCKVCAHEMKSEDSRWTAIGQRSIGQSCPACGARFRADVEAIDLRPGSHAVCEWQRDDQGRPFLEVSVEGWPIVTRPIVHHLEPSTRGQAWQIVTQEGERLESLKPINKGPLDTLISATVNHRLASDEPLAGAALERVSRKVSRPAPEIQYAWHTPHGYDSDHLLRMWLDGWEVDLFEAPLLRKSPKHEEKGDGGWRALMPDGRILEKVSGMGGEGAARVNVIGATVQRLVNERLELLWRNSKYLGAREPRKARQP